MRRDRVASAMSTARSATTDAARLLPEGTRLGAVSLAVTDRERALRFWTGVLGLVEVGGASRNGVDAGDVAHSSGDPTYLGSVASGGHPLVVLHPGAAGPVVARRTGLYHVALHIPTRKELARVIARLFTLRYANSPTDHLVSETTYLDDPDGNGIELTLETPDRGDFLPEPIGQMMARTKDGELRSGRDPVDLDSLFAELDQGDDLSAPLVTDRVHHVHLHVGDIERDGAFYRDLIGFPQQLYVPGFQMIDFSLSADTVVHTLALNAWSGPGAKPAPPGGAGLRYFTLEVPDQATVDAMAGRLATSGWPFERVAGGLRVADPSANVLVVRVIE